jgi:putative zinc finger/helix-turn-helix YgiT family protein
MNPNGFDSTDAFAGYREAADGCPSCGADEVRTEKRVHRFLYGPDGTAVELQIEVPVHVCTTCDLEYLDSTAEVLRHEAVCRHLGVLTPGEIRSIRKDVMRLSRAEFARVTGIGEATIARWESGSLIQNLGYDRYLRLLAYPENVSRLRGMTEQEADEIPFLPKREHERRFRALVQIDDLRIESKGFRLRKEVA